MNWLSFLFETLAPYQITRLTGIKRTDVWNYRKMISVPGKQDYEKLKSAYEFLQARRLRDAGIPERLIKRYKGYTPSYIQNKINLMEFSVNKIAERNFISPEKVIRAMRNSTKSIDTLELAWRDSP